MTGSDHRRPLEGVVVVEVAGGAAAAWCGRMLADAGATVVLAEASPGQRLRGLVRVPTPLEEAWADCMSAGKRLARIADREALEALCSDADLVLVGEASGFDASAARPRRATVELSWFGRQGPYRDWTGNDLVVQALTGMPQMVGSVEGPPVQAGDRQSTSVAGVTAYIAALAALLAPAAAAPRRFEVGILEANLVLSEMHMHFFERDGVPMRRCGINRFMPNSPVGVYPCREGWIGITATTPDQWKSLCAALEMHEQAADEGLSTRELRFTRLDEVEEAMIRALSRRSADEWAAVGRRHKVPMVVVPDAAGILAHPIFELRSALAELPRDGAALKVPRTPFGLTRTPVAQRLQALGAVGEGQGAAGEAPGARAASSAASESSTSAAMVGAGPGNAGAMPGAAGAVPEHAGPLAGLTVVDFAMGWAGPLATRLLADLGADVLKIEAGRYPDWWRGVNWTPEYIEARSYEDAKPFCAMNRGKRGISVDLTTDVGRALALELIAGADAVVENQAAGVMGKLGLGHETLLAHNPGLVMVSMSAFGTGNPWSDTRAYGSTLEQGAGVPSFAGFPGTQPTMYHLAYGDPVGGLFGCAAALTALHERRRSGQGQYVNLSMVEAMLQFATPALLERQLTGAEPPRRGNRHAAMAPHGFYPAAGEDQWIAVSAPDHESFARLARAIGRPAWAQDPALATLEGRAALHDEIDAAIAAWSSTRDRDEAAQLLQEAGVAAAPLHHAQELFANAHLEANGFYIDLVREFSGPQRQGGIAIVQDGRRLGARQPAPLLGEHSREVLLARAGVDPVRYERLVREDVITFAPKGLRSAMPPASEGAAQRRIA